ncbi:hypothetical protein ACFQS6_01730 [Xanthomonas populi]|uniref:Uncharacterized protein n=1 Tax=Xanthomonas populi TaxID=53414 RepID=A0A2S7EVG8_9XANT|nr:hypothetical protein [Xanthomonas populi]PPU97049.1 hypothetical protein XpopCFBP1817_05625 [Xanthomonas populi]
MEMSDILMQQSSWTWHIMASSANLGEMIREDALTSVNLTTINQLPHENNLPLHTTSFQGAHLEREYGADWMWRYGEGNACLIQPKRLDVVRRLDLLPYTFDMQQMAELIDCANILGTTHNIDAIHYYVLYNSMIPKLESREKFIGCTCVNAYLLFSYIESSGLRAGQKEKTLSFQSLMARKELNIGP